MLRSGSCVKASKINFKHRLMDKNIKEVFMPINIQFILQKGINIIGYLYSCSAQFFSLFLAEAGFRCSAEAGEGSGRNDGKIVHTQCKLNKWQAWNMYSYVITAEIKSIYFFCIMY